jgi:hypothetical protein
VTNLGGFAGRRLQLDPIRLRSELQGRQCPSRHRRRAATTHPLVETQWMTVEHVRAADGDIARRFGQLQNLSVPDTFDDPITDAEIAAWEGDSPSHAAGGISGQP